MPEIGHIVYYYVNKPNDLKEITDRIKKAIENINNINSEKRLIQINKFPLTKCESSTFELFKKVVNENDFARI